MQWFILELIVYGTYVVTLIILMIKSRFINVGVDQSSQFEPFMMSQMANRIIKNIKFDFEKTNLCKKKLMRDSVNNTVYVSGVWLRINLTEHDFREARDYIKIGENDVVKPEAADKWVFENLKGMITKDDLDYMRYREINELDMMQNSSIIYHSESIIEAQIMVLVANYVITEKLDWSQAGKSNTNIMIVLGFEHIFSYICEWYRRYEIKQSGLPDINGILRAKNEFILSSIQILFDCLIIGYMFKYITDVGK